MAPPPAKRQRKLLSSDNEDNANDENLSSKRKPSLRKQAPKKQQLPSRSRAQDSTTNSPKRSNAVANSGSDTSPTKRKRGQKASQENAQVNSLHTFFKPATEEERWHRTGKVINVRDVVEEKGEDEIEDDSCDETPSNTPTTKSDQLFPLDRRKAQKNCSLAFQNLDETPALPIGSQKFTRSSGLAQGSTVDLMSHRTWAERFTPENLDELALHKKKLSDVHRCLADMLDGEAPQKLLILKGPAGSGKSTVVSILSRILKFSIVDWRNPVAPEAGRFASISTQLEDFLGRGGRFGDLTIDSLEVPSTSRQIDERSHKRVLLIEEFPSSTSGPSSALNAFRDTLLRYLSSDPSPLHFTPRKHNNPPDRSVVVIVISESLVSSSVSSSETFTAQRLLGPDIINHPRTRSIEFNPTAPSFVTKALELVLKKEARISRRRRIPGPAVIKRLAENGDIRNAINSLEFLCVRGDEDNIWSGRTAAKSKKSEKDGIALTETERQSLELLNQREAIVGIFHAVGKVVYNKRDPDAPGTVHRVHPPDHPRPHARYMKPQTSVDELMDETGTDIETFIATLHENYALSCKSDNFVDIFASCSQQLSDADIIGCSYPRASRRFQGSFPRNSTTDTIRQNEITFQVAVRGLLFALPSPVARAEHPGGKKSDSFKMFFPASIRLWRLMEEIEGLANQWLARLLNGQLEDPSLLVDVAEGGVASWKSWSRGLEKPVEDAKDEGSEQARILVSKHDLLLERLPYLKHATSQSAQSRRDLDRMTTFAGLGPQGDETLEDEGSMADAGLTNELASDILPPQNVGRWKDANRSRNTETETREQSVKEMEKLYISDDDIED